MDEACGMACPARLERISATLAERGMSAGSGLGAYGVGIPLAFLYVALKEENLPHIKADQEHNRLRLKQRRDQNAEYDFHNRWHKVYYRYEPEYRWWCGVIFARKFAICFVTIMFNGNPMFQASLGLAVLFASFGAHMACQPFLRPPAVVRERAVAADLH